VGGWRLSNRRTSFCGELRVRRGRRRLTVRDNLAEEGFHSRVIDRGCILRSAGGVKRRGAGGMISVGVVECQFTRCRDNGGGVPPKVATRARWRVDWGGSDDSAGDVIGAGSDAEGDGEKVVDGGSRDVEGGETGGDDESVVEVRPVGRPCAASAFTTASQPFSRVLIRSLSSSFSRSLDSGSGTGTRAGAVIPMPARSWRFSSSSSATLRSR